MKKHISFVSLALLLVPSQFYAMENNFEKRELPTEEVSLQLTQSAIMKRGAATQATQPIAEPFPLEEALPFPQPTQHAPYATQPVAKKTQPTPYVAPESLQLSNLALRKKALQANNTTHETKPWRITGIVNSFRDATAIALSEISYLEGKPDNVTTVSHKLEWGIQGTLEKIQTIRDANKPYLTPVPEIKGKETEEQLYEIKMIKAENRCKIADGLLATLRQERQHNENLKKILEGAFLNDVPLNEDVVAKAHAHLEKSRIEALTYQANALKESQQYLQEDKALRRTIYHDIKLVKEDLTYPSDDEYDDNSICNHYKETGLEMGFLTLK